MKCLKIPAPAAEERTISQETAHKILVIESDSALRSRINTLLSENGYTVNSFSAAADALDELKRFPDYALVISSYAMPKMKGDDILEKARKTAPDTLRILIAEASEMQTLVNAINIAEIHACLTLPLQEPDVLCQVSHCCTQYETIRKQKNLLQLTRRQNKQLFQLAGRLKKKQAQYAGQIESKNKKIRILESRVRSVFAPRPVLLNDILDKWNISFSPNSFSTLFPAMHDEIQNILETAAFSAATSLPPNSAHTQDPLPSGPTDYQDMVDVLMPRVLALLKKMEHPPRQDRLEDFFALTLSDDNTQAFLEIKKTDPPVLTPALVKQFLEKKMVVTGIMPDHDITSLLFRAAREAGPFLIARGTPPRLPKDADIRYHFPTRFRHAGRVRQDGSIDFSDRGEIPHVEEDTLLAEKIFPEPGIPGIDVFGRMLMVDEPADLDFSPGPGTRVSEDGNKIYAAVSGQPLLDALGILSVCPEFQIKGDLGFETGDVHFKGNVIVQGTVKPGFKISCASLTAKEINGAHIDITGDLNVSHGIVDTKLVRVKGTVQAKFIHNSTISAFGDLVVQKEIIDSHIFLSGACVNANGMIINSRISAKLGIAAGTVGKPGTQPSILKVGVDEQVNQLVAAVNAKLDIISRSTDDLASRIVLLEKEDQDLHAVISQHAYVQDRAELEIKDIETKAAKLKTAGNMSAVLHASKALKALQKKAKRAEADINAGFARQDVIAGEITKHRKQIAEYAKITAELSREKDTLLAFSNREKPLPKVTVARKIESRTQIFGTAASIILKQSHVKCHVQEILRNKEGKGGPPYHEIQIT
ncbi:MAG: flagellar assembly protein A [Desulfotignum sp.]|nr:flagellar assembly protein A [Desulfotignum sp.]